MTSAETVAAVAALDPRLAEAAARLEGADPARSVIAGQVFRLPFARLRTRLSIQSPRRFNILEEFILRAAAELEPPPTSAELAALLGLDQLFVDTTLKDLEALKTVTRGAEGAVALTRMGRQFYEQGRALQAPEHRPVSLLYRAVVDDLRVWNPPPAAAAELPLLPGVTPEDRQDLTARALRAAELPRVVEAVAADGLRLHVPEAGRVVTAADQTTVEDMGFLACGVLVVQDTAADPGADDVTVHAIDLETQESDAGLQRVLDEWLRAGRVQLRDFLPPDEVEEAETAAAAEPGVDVPEYQQRYLEQVAAARKGQAHPGGVERLGAGSAPARVSQLLKNAQRSVLWLLPHLTTTTAGEALQAEIQRLAERRVLSIIGWGVAEEREQEPQSPPPGLVEGLHRLLTPDGLPAAPVWWVGEQYGQDVLIDRSTLLSVVPNQLRFGGRRWPGGSATYVVTAPDLVATAWEDVEPTFARAARLSWHAAVRSPLAARLALERSCVTWVAVRRPSEALSHVLKLAANDPEAILVAWELLAVTALALRPLSADELDELDVHDALRRAVPEFLDWADSAAPGAGQPPFVANFREWLTRAAQQPSEALPEGLGELQRLWAETPREPGRPAAEVFTVAADDTGPARPKKRTSRRASE